ncbi:hypothetical protein [Lewinella cohaerens]|uniref:hypothetical protein n=1 Tax=Lewinella cohaerens TaxID=70995 RepID=UPI000379EA9E|nr:hypothetical protein [Lewinella cohaerens]
MKKYLISAVLLLFSLGVFGVRIAKGVTFKQNVSGYLKRAADANTIDMANAELTKVINYLEANNLTSGYTSVMWETPDEDIGFWYQNLKASQQELETLNSDSALERTNVLMKLRETLLDTGEKTKVTIPKGLSVYPDNLLWGVLTLSAFIAMMASFIVLIPNEEKNNAEKVAGE